MKIDRELRAVIKAAADRMPQPSRAEKQEARNAAVEAFLKKNPKLGVVWTDPKATASKRPLAK